MAFGKIGLIGAMAKTDIHSNKAFLFIPYTMIITPGKALDSEIGHIFQDNKPFFSHKHKSHDDMLYLFIMHEKLKGDKSFWFPYFQIIPEITTLIDWTDLELAQL